MIRTAKLDSVSEGAAFNEEERRAVYRAIHERRDVRSGYCAEPLAADLLRRLLEAAHSAPSVGLMQPTRFLLIRDAAVKHEVYAAFLRANEAAARAYEGDRGALYRRLKLEAILEAPQNLCVLCEADSTQGHGLGRQTAPETAIYSTVCAVQNLWLAARAEGVGVGWVSILDAERLRSILHVPATLVPVAYLCLGYVSRFDDTPELERKGWESRRALDDMLHFDRFPTNGSATIANSR